MCLSLLRIAQSVHHKDHPYLTLRDELGTIFEDEDFVGLFPTRGQPALSPWQLALIAILRFRENLLERQAAEAVRDKLSLKYLLGLELTDRGFDFSVLSEFRDRLLLGGAEGLLLDKLLERCQALGLVRAQGKQRTDATHILASIRVMNRLELVAETLRAALNELATEATEWLRGMAQTLRSANRGYAAPPGKGQAGGIWPSDRRGWIFAAGFADRTRSSTRVE